MTIPQLSLAITLATGWKLRNSLFVHPMHGVRYSPFPYASSNDLMTQLETEMDGLPVLQPHYLRHLKAVCRRERNGLTRIAWLALRARPEWRAEAWLKTRRLWPKS